MNNPYAAPESVIAPIPVFNSDAEQIRQAHLSHEASVKSIGTLYYLGAVILLLGLIVGAVPVIPLLGSMGASELALMLGGGLLMLALIVLQWKLAVGIRQLRPWVRIPLIILSILGLIGFPVGTLISAYILYLMFSEKSKVIFSPGYQQVIAATPHIQYRSNVLKTVLIVILIMFVILGMAIYLKA